MDREETLIELVGRLEKAVGKLERILYGDEALGAAGLTERVAKLERTMEGVEGREPVPALWSIGFATFVFAFGLTIKEFRDWFGIPPLGAYAIGALLIAISMFFFYAGLGWVRKWFR